MKFGSYRSRRAPPMRNLTIRFSRPLLFRMGQVCQELGVSRAVLVRTIVNDWLRDFGRKHRRKPSGARLLEE